jgi:hypothetical protein
MRFSIFMPCAAAAWLLCACSPPPLPAGQSARGVREAKVTLAAQGAALKAKLQASSQAVVQPGGWVELRIYANDRKCTEDQVVRQGAMGASFSITLYCDADVPAGTPFTFHAEQVERDATTSEVTIKATYVR